ncbi:60S acidic ribosomal protein P1, partial [Salmonella sp. s54925]|uniref:60S acidic ribosomal protein P1 n=3 Tax=unclassified Salmonella TaxID=2614656 RepID=UPI0039815B74
MSSSELACVYSALILHDDDVAITGDKIQSLISAAGLEVEPFWPGMFAKALEGRNIGDLLCNVGTPGGGGGGGGGGPRCGRSCYAPWTRWTLFPVSSIV